MGRTSKEWIFFFFFEKWNKLKNQEKSPASFSVRHDLVRSLAQRARAIAAAGQGRAGQGRWTSRCLLFVVKGGYEGETAPGLEPRAKGMPDGQEDHR